MDWNFYWNNKFLHNHSHTLRGCVDWNQHIKLISSLSIVTPYVGVWIETYHQEVGDIFPESHPTWVCGLKLLSCLLYVRIIKSHPTWVCGLKQGQDSIEIYHPNVTPYVGVWIETICWWRFLELKESHPTWVCGLKLIFYACFNDKTKSHPTWVCGLKHYLFALPDQGQGHTLRGCVDWN